MGATCALFANRRSRHIRTLKPAGYTEIDTWAALYASSRPMSDLDLAYSPARASRKRAVRGDSNREPPYHCEERYETQSM